MIYIDIFEQSAMVYLNMFIFLSVTKFILITAKTHITIEHIKPILHKEPFLYAQGKGISSRVKILECEYCRSQNCPMFERNHIYILVGFERGGGRY